MRRSLENEIESVVIVKFPMGYQATLRFKNHKNDIIFAHTNKNFLYRLIERYIG